MKFPFKAASGIAALLFATAYALAHSNSRMPATPAADSPAGSLDDILALEKEFAGTWNIRERDEPSIPEEKPLTGEGTESYSREPGGMPFIERYHAVIGGQEAYETAYFWWDGSAKELRGLWCSSFNGEGCSPFRFWREGDRWVMEGQYVSKGERFAWRENFSKHGPDAFLQTLEVGKPGEALKPAARINATRRK